MVEISKELLSAVLGVEVTNVRDTMYDNELRFETPDEELRRKFSPYVPKINIYELGFKCKEWALKNGYLIGSNTKFGVTIIDLDTHIIQHYFAVPFENFTEYEIKACEWILKEINK